MLGHAFACARRGADVLCWGWCRDGRCGADGDHDRLVPARVDLPPARGLAVGFDHACAVLEDSRVRCWGNNIFGQLGDGRSVAPPAPVAVPGLLAAAVRADPHRTTAVLADGTARGWGREGGDRPSLWPGCADPRARAPVGRRGVAWAHAPTEPSCPTPTALPLAGVVQVVTGNSHACALLRGGQVHCWGSDAYGAVGDVASGDADGPVRVDLR